MLIKKKSDSGTDIYKQLKLRLLHLFRPETEDTSPLRRTACWSSLANRLSPGQEAHTKLLCECKKTLEGCCCTKVVTGLWKRQLPIIVRAGVMGKDLDNVHNKADDNYASQAVRCGAVASVLSVGLDKTLPALQSAAVAAIKKKVWAPAAQTPSNCDKVMRVVEYQRKSPLISI